MFGIIKQMQLDPKIQQRSRLAVFKLVEVVTLLMMSGIKLQLSAYTQAVCNNWMKY